MDEKRIELFLQALNSTPKQNQNREGWVQAECPLAKWAHEKGTDNSPSFGIRIKPEAISTAHCFSCNFSGDLMDLVLDIGSHLGVDNDPTLNLPGALELLADEEEGALLEIPDWEEGKQGPPETVVWPESVLKGYVNAWDVELAKQYLLTRGVAQEGALDWQLIWDGDDKRVVFPIRDWDGNLTGCHGRSVVPGAKLRYLSYGHKGQRNMLVWFGEHAVDPEKPVILTESVFDLLRLVNVYPNVLAALSAGLSKFKVDRVGGFPEYLSWFDYGKGGEVSRNALDKYLPGCRHITPTEEEDDAGATPLGEIWEKLAAIKWL